MISFASYFKIACQFSTLASSIISASVSRVVYNIKWILNHITNLWLPKPNKPSTTASSKISSPVTNNSTSARTPTPSDTKQQPLKINSSCFSTSQIQKQYGSTQNPISSRTTISVEYTLCRFFSQTQKRRQRTRHINQSRSLRLYRSQ